MSVSPGIRVALVLARREVVGFARRPARVAAAIGTPLVIWAFMASGFSTSFRPAALGSTSYASFMLPGMLTLVVVFTSIFTAISIIEERREGWLQAVLAAPAPRWSIALGKSLGAAALGFAQGVLLLALAPSLGIALTLGSLVLTLAALALTALAMSALGASFAWRSRSTAGFHAVMNLVLMPMWLLSGAFFPAESAVPWLAFVMHANPLTWCTDAIRAPLVGDGASWSLAGSGAFALVTFAAAIVIVRR